VQPAALLLAFAWLAGCQPEEVTEPVASDDTGGTRFEAEVEAPEPTWDAATAAATLEAILAGGLPSAMDYESHFLETTIAYAQPADAGEGVPACPSEGANGGYAWEALNGCDTQDGWRFFGLAEYLPSTEYESGSTFARYSYGIVTDFEVLGPDGQTFDSGGSAGHHAEHDLASDTVQAFDWISGSAQITWADDWFADNVSGTLEAYWHGPDRTMALNGGVAWTGVALYFQDVLVDPGHCEEPSVTGAVHLLGPEDAWYVLDFGEACDTCAEVTFHVGTALGTACVDVQDSVRAHGERLEQPARAVAAR